MDAVPVLQAATPFPSLAGPTGDGALDDARREDAWVMDDDRLPPGIAYSIILLLSVGSWALIATIGLWMYRVLG